MALLVDAVPLRNGTRFDAMARVEHLIEDLRHVLARAGATRFDEKPTANLHHSHAEASATQIETANFSA